MEVQTEIRSNGSKWAGDEPDSVETLLGVIADCKLDQRHFFDGQFIHADARGFFFFGNFEDVSHVFSIVSNDPEIVRELTTAIVRNVVKFRAEFAVKAKEQAAWNKHLDERKAAARRARGIRD